MADFALSVSLVPLPCADISDHLGSSCKFVGLCGLNTIFSDFPGGMVASYIVLLELLGSRPAPVMPCPLTSGLWLWNLNSLSHSLGVELYLFPIVSSSVDRLKISFSFFKRIF